MQNSLQKQYIKTVTIEKANAWLTVSFLAEESNGETIIVSAPKIVKIIPKKTAPTLRGDVLKNNFVLVAGKKLSKIVTEKIISPYISEFIKEIEFCLSYSARPPTAII